MDTLIFHLEALQLADEFNIKEIKDRFHYTLLAGQNTELFYQVTKYSYLYVSHYGTVAMANIGEAEKNKIFSLLAIPSKTDWEEIHPEKYQLEIIENAEVYFTFNTLIAPVFNQNLIRICLFSMAQSVALDYYTTESDKLLNEVKIFAKELEQKGRLRLGKKEMLKFISKSLNTKNNIVGNLYIFEVPTIVWDDEYLNRVNRGFSQFFELSPRFKEVEYKFHYIDDNLDTYLSIYHQRENSRLEWIIIGLILIEVGHLIISTIFS